MARACNVFSERQAVVLAAKLGRSARRPGGKWSPGTTLVAQERAGQRRVRASPTAVSRTAATPAATVRGWARAGCW